MASNAPARGGVTARRKIRREETRVGGGGETLRGHALRFP